MFLFCGEESWDLTLGVLMAMIHLAVAFYVWKDCKKLTQQGRETVILPPWLWVISITIFSVFGLGLYWLAHHSRLARKAS